ncbi:hypothetical protein D9611_001737 [Ephemerocybe angulata]|uniref:Coiled-coil domain-containing protein 16 n=1 Tax=Ephemerocybe angulata TaxID=980116 RepID=A0A8H5CJ13_9AGAR|nr:hypothetical protein D9611_001737 [Tulosesus angulatus]
MSDARALLKAKRAEARISHPYASYTSSDQLRCSICSVPIKHASAWEGHLGSKAHRTAVAAARARAQAQAQQQQQQQELEDAAANASLEDRDRASPGMGAGKRKASVSEQEGVDLEAKKRRTAASSGAGGFPADFFSDASRSIPQPDEDEEEERDAMAVDDVTSKPAPQGKTAVDEEYERFQRELLSMQSAAEPVAQKHEAFARATVAGEEELFTEQQKSGFEGGVVPDEGDEQAKGEEETEQQKRERREREDRELIMDRLLEEEQIQEEADMRVASMKARVEALKKKREARKAGKAQGKTT